MTNYLHGGSWEDHSRDERFFCAEFYHPVSRMSTRQPFIEWLNKTALHDGAPMSNLLPVDDQWNIGYEVCFYRDYINAFTFEGSRSIRDKFVPGTEREKFMFKRTFDLALFHPEHLVIIEAKAHEGFCTKQLGSFATDKVHLAGLLQAKHWPGQQWSTPNVTVLGLCSSHYAGSNRAKPMLQQFEGVFTWKDLANAASLVGGDEKYHKAMMRADGLMLDGPGAEGI